MVIVLDVERGRKKRTRKKEDWWMNIKRINKRNREIVRRIMRGCLWKGPIKVDADRHGYPMQEMTWVILVSKARKYLPHYDL